MVRCEEFYEKWKRDPNWCRKCATSVWYINRYIELTESYPQPSLKKNVVEGENKYKSFIQKLDET